MYRRQITSSNQNADRHNANKDIIDDQSLDDDILSTGNENVNKIFNGNNLDDILDPSATENFSLQDFKAKILDKHPGQKQAIDAMNKLFKIKQAERNEKKAENISRQDLKTKILDKHPAQKQAVDFMNQLLKNGQSDENEGKIENNKEPLIKEEPIEEEENDLEPDMIVNVSKSWKKRSKAANKAKKSKNSPAVNAAAPQNNVEDLSQIDETLAPVRGWDFVAEKLPARKKQGFLSKLGSWMAYYSGKTIGKIGGIIAAIVKGIGGWFTKGPGTFGGMIKGLKGSGRYEPKNQENRDAIPGWDGAKFQNEEAPDDQVNADFRRVPEIWSYPTAEKAAEGNDEDRNSKPRDPVISVYIGQGSKKYTANNKLQTGHSGIGIEYSRYSANAGRWQRYNVRFGYYMGGGFNDMAQNVVTNYNNATITGQLMNEKGHLYTISRSYPAKPKQVNKVLRAAETYAERGGYNAYTRNCTTFAKEMIVDTAQIKGAEAAFAKDEVYLQAGADVKMFGAAMMAPIAKAEMENSFEKIGRKKDLSYQNFGNKMASREDYERYKNSIKFWSSQSTETDSPNGVAENLLRAEGEKSGTIGIHNVIKNGDEEYADAPIQVVLEMMPSRFADLKNTMSIITPADKLFGEGKTEELQQLMKDLTGEDITNKLSSLLPQDETALRRMTSQSDLMQARTILTDTIKKLNRLLFGFYRNDKRIQEKVLTIISMLNHAISRVDEAYETTDQKDLERESDELYTLRSNFSSKNYTVKHNGVLLPMTPSKYEAWLQIYKSPQEALTNYSKYVTLHGKEKDNEVLSAEEQKDLSTLKRINDLAKDFEKSHRYMMEKEEFNQQDVDYAFSLNSGKSHHIAGLQNGKF